MLIILFGQAGSGKNYVGKVLANHFNYYYWDADEVLPLDMHAYIKAKKSFTDSMRAAFTKTVIDQISKLYKEHTHLVVSQALYKEKNRREIAQHFPEALFIHIQADSAVLHERIKNRQDWVDEEYVSIIQKNFEVPTLAHQVLVNNGSKEIIIKQLETILADKPNS